MKTNAERVKEISLELKSLQNKSNLQRIRDYLMITAGAVIYAVAVSLFLDPNSLAPGGVTGIAIILNRLIHVETGTLIFLINIPIMILGIWKFGVRFILSTLYCIAVISYSTNALAPFGAATEDPFLAAVVGGALSAVAIGFAFKSGATTGGTDIIVKVMRLHFPHLKTGSIFLATDLTIVTCSAIVFRDLNKALYAGLVVFITSILLDMVLYGRDGAKLIYIISDYSENITKRLLDELDIGVTHMRGVGAYSGKEKNVIMCVIRKQLSPKAEEIVKQEDPLAFMIVTSATEIYGEGYKNIFSERL